MDQPIIVRFRQDLRIQDNPALYEAAKKGTVLPLYIWDEKAAGEWASGAASRVWIHHALKSLNESLDGNLVIMKGDTLDILKELIERVNAKGLYQNRCYEPWRIALDKKIKQEFTDIYESFNGSLLWQPWEIKNQTGDPYKVFTPFFRKGCLNAPAPRQPIGASENLELRTAYKDLDIEGLNLLPSIKWDQGLTAYWDISENGAHAQLNTFLESGLDGYKDGRNFPAKENISRLSPYLHHGLLSPNQIWYASDTAGKAQKLDKDLSHFHSELGWREFSYSLLYHFPQLPSEPLQEKFKAFPWSDKQSEKLEAWQKGQTGFPIVDAAMRELYATGYMHNRTRMIVGSFLVKNMLLHWHHGEKWFWDTLFDADLANNSARWQWIAGCGADAAPYFRIFNPMLQSEKHDAEGDYIRKWVPEIAKLSNKDIHTPWQATEEALKNADIKLGETYPKPILDHHVTRDRALHAYSQIKKDA